MDKNDDSCPPSGLRAARLRLVLLRSGLGEKRRSVEQKEDDDQSELDIHFYAAISAHLDVESSI
jgi:hypothetical protein